MGEYAKLGNESVKIGTCEDMYYLRAGQVHLVKHETNNVDPVADRESLRFRFPFPDEDGVLPGSFKNHARTVALWGLKVPAEVEHGTVQFVAEGPGYLVSLPCPESTEAETSGLKFHRNGFRGAVHIVQQRWVGEQLVLIAQCGGCGAKYRLSTIADAAPYVEACIKEAEKESMPGRDLNRAKWWKEIAARILAGYKGEVVK